MEPLRGISNGQDHHLVIRCTDSQVDMVRIHPSKDMGHQDSMDSPHLGSMVHRGNPLGDMLVLRVSMGLQEDSMGDPSTELHHMEGLLLAKDMEDNPQLTASSSSMVDTNNHSMDKVGWEAMDSQLLPLVLVLKYGDGFSQ